MVVCVYMTSDWCTLYDALNTNIATSYLFISEWQESWTAGR